MDQQVTNLSRYSIFFPEKRQFFVENSDIFSQVGFSQIRPFFSRKIGLKEGNPVPIIGGARLSGKLNKNWRIGAMNMQTEGVGDGAGIEATNYTVAAVQRKIGKRSSLDGIFVNRQGFLANEINYSDYNRVIGLDFNYRSANNKYTGKAFYHHSFSPDITKDNQANATWFNYSSRHLIFHWNHEYVGKDYNADVGFVPRSSQINYQTGEVLKTTYWRWEPIIFFPIFTKTKSIPFYTTWDIL